MATTEVTVIVPMFLDNTRQVAFNHASQIIQKENTGEEGDTIVLQRPKDAGPFWELTLQTTARDFHKTVRLQASHDRATWVEVTTDALFDFSSHIDVRKTTLAFTATDASAQAQYPTRPSELLVPHR